MISKRLAAAVSVPLLVTAAVYCLKSTQPEKNDRSAKVRERPVNYDGGTIHVPQAGSRVMPANGEDVSAGKREAVLSEMRRSQKRHAAAPSPELKMAEAKSDKQVASVRHSPDDEAPIEPTQDVEASVGVRLADDVRLPAAAMPVDFKMSPVAEKMLKEIVDDYYREVAAAVVPSAAGGPGDEASSGDKTVVVSNGPVAESARQRADYRFRALFGNAAYNRMTMNSALEARLPVAQASE